MSGRLELAQAIVSDGAPLAARVIVNRVWKHHLGRGLVDTASDSGRQVAANWGIFASNKTGIGFKNGAVSYFLGMDATEENPVSLLGGDRNVTKDPNDTKVNDYSKGTAAGAVLILKADYDNKTGKLGYTTIIHNLAGNVLLGDGSVQQYSSGKLKAAFQDAATSLGNPANMKFSFPVANF